VTKSHFAGTEQKVTKKTEERGGLQKTGRDDANVRWRGGRSRCGERKSLGHRQSTAVYGGLAVMWSMLIVGGF